MGENYYEAALRHFIDGCVLENAECYDNAVYLFGYAAECALKSLINVYYVQNSNKTVKEVYGHRGLDMFDDLYAFAANDFMTSILDPALGMKFQEHKLPEVLFRNHPERRYLPNGQFEKVDENICRKAAEGLIKDMVNQHIDGYI